MSTVSLVAQRQGSLKGLVQDGNTGDPIPFATISLMQNNEALPIGTVTDQNGDFQIDRIAFGSYRVIISFIGYLPDTIPAIELSREKPLVDVGIRSVFPSTVDIGEVEVRAIASTVSTKIDRKTYRAADFETARGGNASDVLNKLPSVSVSQDGEVSVRGTADFMVYLNGKPTRIDPSTLLSQIPAEQIESIDVITVPTARYDAQGKGGIININTRTSALDGLSVQVNGMLGGAPWADQTDEISGYRLNDNRYGGGINLLYGKQKLSLFGGVSYNYKNVNSHRDGQARILNEQDGSYKHMIAAGQKPEWYENFTANAGMEYRFSEATQLSASYYHGTRTDGRSAFYVYQNFYADRDKNPIDGIPVDEEWIYNPNTDHRYGSFHTANADLTHRFNKKSVLTASLLYERSTLSRDIENPDYQFDKSLNQIKEMSSYYRQQDNTPLDGYLLSLNWAREFSNGHTLNLGLQPQYFTISGLFTYDTLDLANDQMESYTNLENGLDLSRGIYAGYADYKGSWGKFNFVAGLRLEYTDQQMEIGNPDFFTIFDRPTESRYELQQLDWFPSLHAAYDLGKGSQLNFAASRRISRPPIKNMAPFLYRRHYEVYEVGDPALKPEYITNVELGYEKKAGNQQFGLTAFYRAVDNAIFRVNTVYEEEMVLVRSFTNAGNSKALGAELSANLVARQFARFFIGGSVYNYHVQGDIFGYQEDNTSVNWTLKANATLMLSKYLRFTADFNYRSASVTAQGRDKAFYLTNLALNYTPKKVENLNFSFRMLDILGSNSSGMATRVFDPNGVQIFYQDNTFYRNGPVAELGVTYTINKYSNGQRKAESSFGKAEF
ncbi:MAG: outer membrane beta-barrel family protein [Bacteroidales bacterium]|nr:outer membrane beta-barrel family protein [Bacteroidales bacterium]